MCTRLDDEIAALHAIYADLFEDQPADANDPQHPQRRVIKYKDDFCALKLSIPASYPSCEDGNVVSLVNLTFQGTTCKISSDSKLDVQRAIESIIEANVGNETLFDVIEYVRGRTYLDESTGASAEDSCGGAGRGETHGEPREEEAMPTAGATGANETAVCGGDDIEIIHGEVTTERKSQFLSHLAYVTSMVEVEQFRSTIVSDRRYSRATHNIFAYRFTCPRTGVVYHDNDDDGEDAAGGRLAELLRLMGADGVAVIVSRWFGGTLLGPDRFKFISNSARRLLEDQGVGSTAVGGGGKKRAAKGKTHN